MDTVLTAEQQERKAHLEAFFNTTFSDADFFLTEEEEMAIREERERLEKMHAALAALRVRTDLDKDEYERLAKVIALEYLSGNE